MQALRSSTPSPMQTYAAPAKSAQKSSTPFSRSKPAQPAEAKAVANQPWGAITANVTQVAAGETLWGRNGLVIQRKMTLGTAGDKYEDEADRLAPKIVQQIHQPGFGTLSSANPKGSPPPIQLKAPRPLLQLKAESTGGAVAPEVESAINGARGRGQALSPKLQAQMGAAMGTDFSQVKIHTGALADRLNQSLNAKAFTTGQDLFFKRGEYQPKSQAGQELIAHELTHVTQSTPDTTVQRKLGQRGKKGDYVRHNREVGETGTQKRGMIAKVTYEKKLGFFRGVGVSWGDKLHWDRESYTIASAENRDFGEKLEEVYPAIEDENDNWDYENENRNYGSGPASVEQVMGFGQIGDDYDWEASSVSEDGIISDAKRFAKLFTPVVKLVGELKSDIDSLKIQGIAADLKSAIATANKGAKWASRVAAVFDLGAHLPVTETIHETIDALLKLYSIVDVVQTIRKGNQSIELPMLFTKRLKDIQVEISDIAQDTLWQQYGHSDIIKSVKDLVDKINEKLTELSHSMFPNEDVLEMWEPIDQTP